VQNNFVIFHCFRLTNNEVKAILENYKINNIKYLRINKNNLGNLQCQKSV